MLRRSVTILLVVLASALQAWMPDPNARIQVKLGDETSEQFVGNTTAPDHFRILDKDDFSVIVGGRNTVYNLSLYDLSENVGQRIVWQSTDAHRELCQLKGKSVDDCQNFPRVAARSHGRLLVCGTNAFKPLCRRYARHPPNHHLEEFDGSGRSPYDPQHNSTAIFADGQLYTATAADFSGTDPLIYREPVRTKQSDMMLLNDPSFVGAVASTSHAYFFYRETAVEYMNCGKAVYSRVARVCLNDKGSPHTYNEGGWTSFLKARLNCSMPGEYPFYFDEIQATTELINGIYGSGASRNDIIYTVFTTPRNAIGGSAVCVFSMRDILEAFDGPFKEQSDMNSNWLPLKKEKLVPKPRPGTCVEDSRTLSAQSVNFVRSHPLMDKSVQSFSARPLLIRVSLQYRFSAIAVHPQVQAMNGNKYDVMYVGTDDGRVIKAVNVAANEGDFDSSMDEETKNPVRTAVISEVQVLPQGTPIKQMHVALTTEKLIVASGDTIKAVALSHCSTVQSCRDCVGLQDPHCAWDSKQQQCAWVGNRQFPNPERFLQNVEYGKTEICNKLPALIPGERHNNKNPGANKPASEIAHKSKDVQNEILIEVVEANDLPGDKNINNKNDEKHNTDSLTVEAADGNIYSAQALLTAVLASCLVTLMVGFVIGYLFSRRFRHPFFTESTPFNEQHNHLNRLSPLETPLNATSYIPPRSKNINIVANVGPLKQDNLNLELGKERTLDLRNSTESLDKDHSKFGTLQKVKKTYI